MRRIFWLVLLVFSSFAGIVSAQQNTKEKFLEWHLRDLFYYDAHGTVAQLDLVPKLLVRFKENISAEKRSALFAEFSPVTQKQDLGDSLVVILGFKASVKAAELIEIANKLSRSGLAEASPVFIIENIEAVLEGIVVEPKTILTADRLHQQMKKYGAFSPRKTFFENSAWVFIVDEVKPPLNLLVFTNLLQHDSWISHAYPRFRFLHDPITASISVEPVSGTVGQVRTATLTVEIFDPGITISEAELPDFGSGLFKPIQGTPTSPSTVVHVPGYLFERLGDPKKFPVRNEKRKRVYAISWNFKHHALGEWTIVPQTVPYTKNGVTKEIKSSGFTLVATSLIGNLEITDMPAPRPLINSLETPVLIPEVALPPIPSYWFDRWVTKTDAVVRYTGWMGLAFAALGILGIGIPIFNTTLGYGRKRAARRRVFEETKKLLLSARESRAYGDYDYAFCRMLAVVFPHLSSQPTWEEIKWDDRLREAFGSEQFELLNRVCFELSRRHQRDFVVSADNVDELDRNIQVVFTAAETVFQRRES